MSNRELYNLMNSKNYVSVDCEFVGTSYRGIDNSLARVSIVDYYGSTLLDCYSRPSCPITDYRYKFTGLDESYLVTKAEDFIIVKRKVEQILKGKLVIGHDVDTDLKVLEINHPMIFRIDTHSLALVKQLALRSGVRPSRYNSFSLRLLTKHLLGKCIQTGVHCSIEDAKATLNIYKLVETDYIKQVSKIM